MKGRYIPFIFPLTIPPSPLGCTLCLVLSVSYHHTPLETVKSKTGTTCYSAAYMNRLEQQRFTISEVAADWRELMIPRRIMRPSIARDSGQLDPRCSTQTYHHPNLGLHPIAVSCYSFPIPLRVGG